MRILTLAILISASLASCGRSDESVFAEVLASIDLQISNGQIELASEAIKNVSKRAKSREEWARLAKRGYNLSLASGIWTQFREVSENALSKFQGAEEFAALASYAAVKQGANGRAAEISREYLASERFKPLADLVWLRAGREGFEDGFLPEYSASLTERDASAFVDAARRLGQPALYLDAAVILAGIGKIDKSLEYIEQFSADYPVPAGYLLYDGARFNDAVGLVKTEVMRSNRFDPMDALLVLDSYARQNDTFEYREFAEWTIQRRPEISPLPYRNLGVVFVNSGNYAAASSISSLGMKFFADDGGLQAQKVTAMRRLGGVNEAVELLQQYRIAFGTNIWFEMIDLDINPSPGGYVRFEMALEELFYANPTDEQVARRLAALYTGERRYDELGQIIDEYETAVGSKVWSKFLRGVIAISREDFEQAAQLFEDVAATDASWQYRYDLALVLSEMGRYDEAKEQFRQTSSLTENRLIRASIFAEIARILIKSGDETGALREAIYALDLDPSLTKARLLVRQLESEAQ